MPIHTAQFPSNWELSAARAINITKFLEGYISAGRLAASGYAEFHPVTSNDTAEGRALNRRVELVVVKAAGTEVDSHGTGSRAAPPCVVNAGLPGSCREEASAPFQEPPIASPETHLRLP